MKRHEYRFVLSEDDSEKFLGALQHWENHEHFRAIHANEERPGLAEMYRQNQKDLNRIIETVQEGRRVESPALMLYDRLSNQVWLFFWKQRRAWRHWLAHRSPKIRTRRPAPPTHACAMCGGPLTRLCALWTGDGWFLFWNCADGCGEEDPLEWWPYHFGHVVNEKDLEYAGIEVV